MGDCCSKFRRNRVTETEEKPRFKIVDGRKYQNVESAYYPFPHDDGEAKRLSMQHVIYRNILGHNHFSPIQDVFNAGGARALDVGCGPGAWALDMASMYPNSSFYGIDLMATFIQNDLPNVTFVEGNILDGLPYPDGTFDLVFSRLLILGLTEEQWRNFYLKELLRVTKPGGWVEIHEARMHKRGAGPSWKRLCEAFDAFQIQRGMHPDLMYELREIMELTGQFSQIEFQDRDLVLGQKGGEWVEKYTHDIANGLESLTPIFSEILQVTPEHYRALLEGFIHETKKYDTITSLIQAYGQKKPLVVVDG